jgi:hypothetical protein
MTLLALYFMTFQELQDAYREDNMCRVRFLRTLYGLPPHEVRRLLEIETPEERGMLRMMVSNETHVARILDLLANVHDHRCSPEASATTKGNIENEN